ncbi:PRTRC system protein C [Metallibacterium scheffleri]|uniref:Multi-ubiquitin domain-containing protein n=1 Tax=Metallibacterium scheffleri TaxID=993689 RepID=A0A4S3KMI2_9GAMM|nr:PRTRC system protein C [Metallibacterium scheffleri]THD10112.1 hypothetical protein B1806_09590 [Metallibacterium scheffleri]
MTEIIRARRVFRHNSTTFQDPAPDLPPEQAVRLFERARPDIAHCTLEGPVAEGDTLVFTLVKPPAQTKGAQG